MYSTVPQMLYEKAQLIPDTAIQLSKDKSGTFQPVSYGEFAGRMLDFGAGLRAIGAASGEHIGLISDNRKEWLVCSMGIMAAGCCDIPRGSEATVKDLSYILSFAECRTVVAEGGYSFRKILECRAENPNLANVILIDPSEHETGGAELDGLRIFSYDEIIEKGREFRAGHPGQAEELLAAGTGEDTATIIFTSGTTGTPKGVELTHRNFICQLKDLSAFYPIKEGDRILCVLPVWHVYEREMENLFVYLGATLCYSKPVVSMMLSDMKKVSPQFLACVPRIWDGLYKAIQKQVGADAPANWLLFKTLVGATSTIRSFYDIIHGRNQQFKKPLFIMKILNKALYLPILFLLPFRALGEIRFFAKAREAFGGSFKMGKSGGGGLPPKIDRFFNSIGIRLMEGYGLTETAPMCCMRNYRKPVLGTIGRILPFCEGRVVDRHGKECAPGQLGVLYIRGPNVMKGYYKQPELTAQVVSEGWFNTGDLVIRTYKGEILVKGRPKATIVLRSGENVEPFPL
ncbi:MAG: AMP-binding protein, partial [Treponemataceae bacterium]|nr:AMP-binding protein [Treponemataceae bacterium]